MNVVTSAYFRVFEPMLAFGEARRRETTRALRAARIATFPEWYLSTCYLIATGAAIAAFIGVQLVLLMRTAAAPALVLTLGLASAACTFYAVRLGFLLYPRLLATGRARAIDAEFPSVAMLCYALARGGMGAPAIFKVVAEERATYGEISREFELVLRETTHLGQDMNGALMSVAGTTPSTTLKGFFEGLVTILNSGADARDYFRRQAQMQLAQAELRMEKEIEQAGLLAESYVSGLLVLPLLLVVVLSVLSVLGTVDTVFIPLIVFGLVPGGTLAYLMLVDMLLPPDTMGAPRERAQGVDDAGMAIAPKDIPPVPAPRKLTFAAYRQELDRIISIGGFAAERARSQRRWVVVAWSARRLRIGWEAIRERAHEAPLSILRVSAPVAAVVLCAGAAFVHERAQSTEALAVGATGVLLSSALVAFVPVSIFHEMRLARSRKIEAALPETLNKLSGFNERGVPLLRSFQILGASTQGPLADEFRALGRDVSWTANLAGAIARMRARAVSRRLRKVAILFERGVAATGDLKEVMEIAASEATTSEGQRAHKRQAMMSYIVVVYVVFAVFLYVVYTVSDLFYGSVGFASSQRGIAPETARVLYLSAVLVQAVCCGLVAGKLAEGRVLSGIKHAAILALAGTGIFYVGVLM